MSNIIGNIKKRNFFKTLFSEIVDNKEVIPHSSNYFYLDIMKCMAIIFVITYHTGAINNNIIVNPGINTYINYFLTTMLATCVPLFFFVNGFLLLNKPLNLERHILKILKILFLYFFWGLITYPIVYSLNDVPYSKQSILIDFMQAKTGYTNHLWFLSAMLGIYIIFPLIKLAFDSNKKYFNYFLVGLFIMAFGTRLLSQLFDIIIYNKSGGLDWGLTKFFSSFNKFSSLYGFALVYFMIGGVMFKHKNYTVSKKIIPLLTIIVAMLVSLSYGIMMSKASNELYDVVWSGYNIIPTILIVCSLFYLLKLINYKNNFFYNLVTTIGRNSLGIYLLHNIIILITKRVYMEFWGTTNFGIRYLYIFIVLFSSLCIALLIKKIPFVNKIITI